jgi:hypothetical protein
VETLHEFAQPILSALPVTAHPLFAHGAAIKYRQFLYEQEPAEVMKIRLGETPSPAVSRVLEAAVDRINSLHARFAQRQYDQRLALDVRAAAAAINALYAIAPVLPAQILPLPGGGLQMEWHHGGLDVEIECPIDDSYHIFMSNDNNDLIDEEVSGRRRTRELFRQVGAALADAVDNSAGLLVIRRPF